MGASIAALKARIPSIRHPLRIRRELVAHLRFPKPKGPVVEVVMDGLGIGKAKDPYNAVARARTPNLDRLLAQAIYTQLLAHGIHVGLLPDNTGNSEVGHNTLGAGRWIEQGALLIDRLIRENEFTNSAVLNEQIQYCLSTGKALHLVGLLQRHRSVHSHTDHIKEIISYAAAQGVKKIYLHGMIDGRDDREGTALETMQDTESFLAAVASRHEITCRLASGGGRMTTTMDRNEEEVGMLERGWQTHVLGEGEQFGSGVEAYQALKERTSKQDQWLPPFVIAEGGEPVGRIAEGDAVITFNYRGDRMVEICQAFEKEEYPFFATRGPQVRVNFAGMLTYDADRGIPQRALVVPPPIEGTMSELLSIAGIEQLAIAERQKLSHVTYFWDGNKGTPFTGETWITDIASDNPSVFAQYPAMKAAAVTARLIESLKTGHFGFARINYANPDMVGHTGDLGATIQAVEAVDAQVGEVVRVVVEELNGVAIVTADHGNADEMVEREKGRIKLDKNGNPVPRIGHTSKRVPCYIALPPRVQGRVRLVHPWKGPRTIRSVTATALNLMGYQTPEHMDPSLIEITA